MADYPFSQYLLQPVTSAPVRWPRPRGPHQPYNAILISYRVLSLSPSPQDFTQRPINRPVVRPLPLLTLLTPFYRTLLWLAGYSTWRRRETFSAFPV